MDLFVKDHDCGDPVEKLYYSCDYEAICIHCGGYLANADEDAEMYTEFVDCGQHEVRKRV